MQWIKSEPGCLMPDEEAAVLVLNSSKQWIEGEYKAGKFIWADGHLINDATHWLRVELPPE